MNLYNTLSRKIEKVVPLKDNTVSIYSCGPTVYDHIHIGNLSSFIYADTLRRVLKSNGYDVNHVMNFTDVDDKTIKRSHEELSDEEPMSALIKLTSHYSKIFLDDLNAIGFNVSDVIFIKATDNIEAMQELIKKLYSNNFAYITEDGVYFSLSAYKQAGKKYGQLVNVTVDSTSHARIRNDEYDKESAHDFALWKLKNNDEPAWGFELDGHQLLGRPGWHIECSAMSVKYLGQPFDIHTGGVDLMFPHHENEIAQSTAQNGDKYANYFFHNEHLLVDSRKMSKSLNNFITLRDIKEKGYDPLAFRLMILQSHYRSHSNFSWENLESAQNRLNDFKAMAAMRWQKVYNNDKAKQIDLEKLTEELSNIMDQDLNTPLALAKLSEIAAHVTVYGLNHEGDMSSISHEHLENMLKLADNLLGLNLMSVKNLNGEESNLVEQRAKARELKDWSKADDIRGRLQERGIGLRDSDSITTWYRL